MKTSKNYTAKVVSAILIGFVFYMYKAKPIGNFGYNQTNRIAIIKKYNDKNQYLNQKAFEKDNTIRYIETKQKGIFLIVEQMPRYKSCEYLPETDAQSCTIQNIEHFADGVESMLSVYKESPDWKIFISFIVDEYGYVKNVETIDNKFEVFADIAVSEFKKMSKFATPGYHNKKAVKVKYNVSLQKK